MADNAICRRRHPTRGTSTMRGFVCNVAGRRRSTIYQEKSQNGSFRRERSLDSYGEKFAFRWNSHRHRHLQAITSRNRTKHKIRAFIPRLYSYINRVYIIYMYRFIYRNFYEILPFERIFIYQVPYELLNVPSNRETFRRDYCVRFSYRNARIAPQWRDVNVMSYDLYERTFVDDFSFYLPWTVCMKAALV